MVEYSVTRILGCSSRLEGSQLLQMYSYKNKASFVRIAMTFFKATCIIEKIMTNVKIPRSFV